MPQNLERTYPLRAALLDRNDPEQLPTRRGRVNRFRRTRETPAPVEQTAAEAAEAVAAVVLDGDIHAHGLDANAIISADNGLIAASAVSPYLRVEGLTLGKIAALVVAQMSVGTNPDTPVAFKPDDDGVYQPVVLIEGSGS